MVLIRRNQNLIIFGTALIWLFIVLFFMGARTGRDTNTHLQIADKLLTNPKEILTGYYLLYSGYAFIIASLKSLFGVYVKESIIIFQIIIVGLIPVITKITFRKVYPEFNERIIAIVSLFLFFPLFDMWLWAYYILTDSVFFVWTCLVFFLMIKGILDGKWWPVILVSAFASVFRPPGFIFFIIIVVTFLFGKAIDKYYNPKKLLFLSLISILIITLITIVIHGAMIYLDYWPKNSGELSVYRNYYIQGWVIENRPSTYHSVPESIFDIILITLDRYLQYFRFWHSEYSIKHLIVNFCYYPSIFALSLYYICSFFKNLEMKTDLFKIKLFFLTILWIHGFTLFFSMTLIEYQGRFFLSVFPPIWVMVIGAFDSIKSAKN